jgi:carboxypeptidase family protein
MKRLVVTILIALSFAVAGNAQTFRGTINGTVTDPSGGLVPNATVKATEIATGLDHTTTTTSDGAFAFQDIPLGLYKVTVTATGFPAYTVDKVEVTAGQIYTLQVKLSLQQQTTTVEVSAAALTLDTTTQTQTMTIPDDVVQNIPLNGRDFTQLISVAPGFGGYNVGGFGSLNGTRPNQINWQINGVDNNDFWHNIPAINQGGVSGIAGTVLPIDAAVEFSVQTSSGPEGGRNAGGTANIVLKSGTNDLHGSLYYYNRNEAFADPSPFFIPSPGTKAPRERNENYGFSAGGPIIKNKTFVFLSYEKQDFVFGLSGIATEPSAAWVKNAGALLAANNVPVSLASCNVLAGLTSQLPASQIPTGCKTSGAGFWPTSGSNSILNLPATALNFFSPSAEFGYSYNGVARLDHQISDKHHLSLHAIIGQGNQTAPLGGSPALGTASSNLVYYFEVAPLHDGNYGAVLNSTLSSRLTNQFLFGASYFNQLFHDNNNSFVTKSLGLFLSPDATKNGQPINGAPNIRITGFEQTGLTPPEGRSDLTLHFTDIVSYSVGKHQFRFGAEVRHGKLNEFYHRRGTGRFVFDGTQGPWRSSATCTGTTANPPLCALADFLAGDVAGGALDPTVTGSTIAVGNPERFVHVNAFNAYVQDSWQLTKKLNLQYGLRFEYFGPMQSDKTGDIANFVPGTGFVIQDGHPLFKPGKDHFAPRLGFAYQPTAKGDLVVRGGLGVFYDQINLNPFLDFRPPIAASQGIQGNAFGSSPVSTYSRSGYQWDAVQAGGASIFPGVQACKDPNCAAATDPKGLSAYSVSPNFRVPYFYNYNLQIEKGFGNAVVWQIGYVGSEGRKLNLVSNINQNGAFPNFGNILQLNTIGTSNYNGLQTILKLRAWHGLSSQFAYTWSHALDEISEYRATVVDDAFNPKRDYGNSDFDTRHLFTIDFTYDVPKAPWASSGLTKRIFNDWQISSVMNWHTGQPYDEIRSYLNVVGNPFASGNGVTIDHKFSAANGGTLWINPTAFCDPNAINPATKLPDPVCTAVSSSLYGNVSRNKWYAPGYGDVDLSFIKNIPIKERVKIQLRADFFNLLNRINLSSGVGALSAFGTASPNGDVCSQNFVTHRCSANFSSTTFGLVSDTIGDFNGAPAIGPGEARNIQLVAKIIF